jgi:hypothetical protein
MAESSYGGDYSHMGTTSTGHGQDGIHTVNHYPTDTACGLGATRKKLFLTRAAALGQESTTEETTATTGMDALAMAADSVYAKTYG